MTVLGLPGVLAGFATALVRIEQAEHEGTEAAAGVIRDAWVANIESEGLVLSGAYRDSIRVVRDGAEVGVVSDVDYATILEFGDSRQAAHPVAERAAEEHASDAFDTVGAHILRAIR